MVSNGSSLTPLLEITQGSETSDYMIVMYKMPLGSLRNNLLIKKYNPNDKFRNLWMILAQLETIHKLDLIHRDFHNGNILYLSHKTLLISDLRLCRSVDQPNMKNGDTYGVLPYIAPEVLRGKPYTKAADI